MLSEAGGERTNARDFLTFGLQPAKLVIVYPHETESMGGGSLACCRAIPGL